MVGGKKKKKKKKKTSKSVSYLVLEIAQKGALVNLAGILAAQAMSSMETRIGRVAMISAICGTWLVQAGIAQRILRDVFGEEEVEGSPRWCGRKIPTRPARGASWRTWFRAATRGCSLPPPAPADPPHAHRTGGVRLGR